MKTAKEFWKGKFDELQQNDTEKLAVTMMAEYANYVSSQFEPQVKPANGELKEELKKIIFSDEFGFDYLLKVLKNLKGCMPFHDGDFTEGESRAMLGCDEAISKLERLKSESNFS